MAMYTADKNALEGDEIFVDFITCLHDEVLEIHGDVHNFTSLLRCCCLKYVAELRPAGKLTSAAPLSLVAAE